MTDTTPSPAPLRIALTSFQVSPTKGSEARHTWYLLEQLAAFDVSVDVFCDQRLSEGLESATLPAHCRIIDVPAPPRPLGFRRGAIRTQLSYLLWQYRALGEIQRRHRDEPYDLAHHLSWGSLALGSPLGRLGLPFIFGPVGGGGTTPSVLKPWFGRAWRRERARNLFVRTLRVNPLARRTLRSASVTLTSNHETYELATRLGGRDVRSFIDSPISRHWLQTTPRTIGATEPRRVIWIGRALARKAPKLAIEAFARYREDHPDATMTMLGVWPQTQGIGEDLRARGLDQAITLAGHVPFDEVLSLLDAAHVLLFSSVRDTLGSQLFEAMARGVPVAAIAIHGTKDLISPDVGALAPVGDPSVLIEGLHATLVEILDDPTRWAKRSAACVELVSTMTHEVRTAQLVALYHELARKH